MLEYYSIELISARGNVILDSKYDSQYIFFRFKKVVEKSVFDDTQAVNINIIALHQ